MNFLTSKYGERNIVKSQYNELEMTLTSKKDSYKPLQLICRVYDEGIHLYNFIRTMTHG